MNPLKKGELCFEETQIEPAKTIIKKPTFMQVSTQLVGKAMSALKPLKLVRRDDPNSHAKPREYWENHNSFLR